MHQIRENVCCWSACPWLCESRGPAEGRPELRAVWGFGAAAAPERCPRRGGSASRPQRDRLPAVWPLPAPAGRHQFYVDCSLRSCRALQAAGAAAPGLRGPTNPPVRGNERNLARGKVPTSEMIRCYNTVSFEPYSVGQTAIDVVPVVT